MSESLVIDFNHPIPLFPLAQCVLLPHASVPLHIFEQRYRQMTSDALDSAGLIAMATYADEEADEDEGRTPLLPCVCIGYVLQHHRLDDGRYNLLLHGVCRAKIEVETDHEPYRTAYLKPLEQPDTMEIDLTEARQRIENLLDDGEVSKLSSVAAIRRWMNDEIPTAVIIDLATMALSRSVDLRYSMLAEPDAEHRAEVMVGLLSDIRRNLYDATKLGPARSKDGYPLN